MGSRGTYSPFGAKSALGPRDNLCISGDYILHVLLSIFAAPKDELKVLQELMTIEDKSLLEY